MMWVGRCTPLARERKKTTTIHFVDERTGHQLPQVGQYHPRRILESKPVTHGTAAPWTNRALRGDLSCRIDTAEQPVPDSSTSKDHLSRA